MQETLRWFGPNDIVSLENISQAGANGVVTALDHIKTGDVWTLEEIKKKSNSIFLNILILKDIFGIDEVNIKKIKSCNQNGVEIRGKYFLKFLFFQKMERLIMKIKS